jgi:8-oxo-dGTP pyrophosphatase MutT (NUDIX family)
VPIRIPPTYRAAWVPFREAGPRDTAADVAIAWIEQRSAESGARSLLVTNDKVTVTVNQRLLAFARRHTAATPRMSTGGARGVPVLAYCPDPAALHLAVQRAHGASLVVVEGAAGQLRGWASVVAPLDLGDPGAPAGRTEPADEPWLDTVALLASEEHGLLAAPEHTLAVLERIAPERRNLLPTALLAHGVTLHHVRRISKLVDALSSSPEPCRTA